jgi:urease accessory protein
LAAIASRAFAHSQQGVAIDFWGGFLHPIFGPDHVIAMVAVGLWGAFLGAPAIWLLPAARRLSIGDGVRAAPLASPCRSRASKRVSQFLRSCSAR